MTNNVYTVLFLCTGNSARSILAEALLNHLGRDKFRAFSAGSHPTGKVNPLAFDLLQRHGFPTEGLRSKAWDEFAIPEAPTMDFVFTVCDKAAHEVCPVWPGHPMTIHWGVADPAAAEGSESEKLQAFEAAFRVLKKRIQAFVNLPVPLLDQVKLKQELEQIGKISSEGGKESL